MQIVVSRLLASNANGHRWFNPIIHEMLNIYKVNKLSSCTLDTEFFSFFKSIVHEL